MEKISGVNSEIRDIREGANERAADWEKEGEGIIGFD